MNDNLGVPQGRNQGFSKANGIPIIATNVGASNDMLEEYGGIIIEPLNSNMIVEAINTMRNKKLRQKISEWNINKVKKCYTIDIVMSQLRELYLEVIESKKMERKSENKSESIFM